MYTNRVLLYWYIQLVPLTCHFSTDPASSPTDNTPWLLQIIKDAMMALPPTAGPFKMLVKVNNGSMTYASTPMPKQSASSYPQAPVSCLFPVAFTFATVNIPSHYFERLKRKAHCLVISVIEIMQDLGRDMFYEAIATEY